MLFLCYPKCSTCQKARKFLDANCVDYTFRHIVEENPTAEELAAWKEQGALPIKKLINTSGMLYRELSLKDKLPAMTEAEIFALLSTNGMLVKRPILVGEGFVLTGFSEKVWKETLSIE